MCGIAGIVNLNGRGIEEGILKRMAATLRHRGPDDEGVYISPKAGLAHKRLSIIDVKGGHQPMSNEDGSIHIVYNGEAYNFQTLREDLKSKGHRFKTKSDTEVVLHLYEEKGVECLKELRGMFAFAIWDVRRERLFLARDRVGQKPLFYQYKDNTLLFGSEIKAILEHDSVRRELNLSSLDNYLTYGYTPSPKTMFKNIKKLAPAHYLILDKNGIKIERYWKLRYSNETKLSFEESKERLYDLLSEATKMRLISDVPLGAFLSGGVDSSCVVALMSKLSSKKVKTFSIGFDEADFDELKYAKEISERFGTEHKELIVKPNALRILPKLAWHYDEPFGDSSCIPTYYVSKMTRDFVTVALSGDGGDESFAGYMRYKGIALAGHLKKLPRGLLKIASIVGKGSYKKRFFEGLINNDDLEGTYIEWLNYFTQKDKRGLYAGRLKDSLNNNTEGYLRNIISSSDAPKMVEKIMDADVNSYLPEDLLVKVDIASMATSLESRSPFLDHKVMEFAASLPLKYKLKGLSSKHILKEVFKDQIPLTFLNRRKKGFGVPLSNWFREQPKLKKFVRDMLLSKESLKRGLFSKDYIEHLLDEHGRGGQYHTYRIYSLLSFEMWHRMFIDREAF